MSRITLSEDEVNPGVLPNVCMVCGVEAAHRLTVSFSWVPAWSYVLLVGGIWPWALFYLVLRRSMVIEVPVCDHHSRYWMWRKWILPIGLSVTLALMIGSTLDTADASLGPPKWAWLASFGVFATTILAAIWLWLSGVRTVAISGGMITLTRVAPQFVKAVEAGRADYHRREQEWARRFDKASGGD